jgi:hypothetical protein
MEAGEEGSWGSSCCREGRELTLISGNSLWLEKIKTKNQTNSGSLSSTMKWVATISHLSLVTLNSPNLS